MTTKSFSAIVLLFLATTAFADWERVAPGVQYQQFLEDGIDVHVTRIDLTHEEIQVVGTRESEKGMRVSEFAKKNKAIVAINGDYFDAKFNPIGLTIGPCGVWAGTKDTSREGVIAIGDDKARIDRQAEVMDPPEEWIDAAISGWPMLVHECEAIEPLPGSAAFTGSPHPRTAVGVSRDGQRLYFVVADGRRPGIPGMTLAQLGKFMRDRLSVCAAINLDGGGSSAMWVDDQIVNKPSDGSERRVADHLAVVYREQYAGCDIEKQPATSTAPRTTTSAPPASSTAPPRPRRY